MGAEELLRNAVETATRPLNQLPDREASRPRSAGHWSPKQVLGHLIDSACNNHARFVRAQFTDDLVFPGYDQEAWVAAQQYGMAPWLDLVALWRSYNFHLARVIEAIPPDTLSRVRTHHNLHVIAWKTVPESQPVTLDYFVRDYVGHLEHHLTQILADYVPVSFDPGASGGNVQG